MADSELWKNTQPRRKVDWGKARARQEEEKEALRERMKEMRRETEERNPEWFKPAG